MQAIYKVRPPRRSHFAWSTGDHPIWTLVRNASEDAPKSVEIEVAVSSLTVLQHG
jgi:hypothetical protein